MPADKENKITEPGMRKYVLAYLNNLKSSLIQSIYDPGFHL